MASSMPIAHDKYGLRKKYIKGTVALERIADKLFTKYSLTNYRCIADTFNFLPSNIEDDVKVTFWGGVTFKIPHSKKGEVRIRVAHDGGTRFQISYLEKHSQVSEMTYARYPAEFSTLDDDLMRSIRMELSEL
jgi:hypothetical protein